jgi:hypothetical protein
MKIHTTSEVMPMMSMMMAMRTRTPARQTSP